jgi:hypothetical protein
MTTSTRKKDPHYLLIKGTTYVEVQLIKSNFTAIKSVLGIVDTLPANATLAASGKEDAMALGCFPLRITYKVSGDKTQSAVVLCSPDKADTAINELRGKNYRGKQIVKARVPRRRTYTI